MVTLHDKISDQGDLADRGRAGSDDAGRQSAAPVKSLTKIFTVLGRQIGCIDERSRKITINRVIGPGTCRFLVALAQLTDRAEL